MMKINLLLIAAVILLNACGGNGNDNRQNNAPDSRAFLFGNRADESGAEDFVAVTNDETLIAALEVQLALPEDERSFFIIGDIANGDAGYNFPWTWHFVPNEWQVAEFAIELCDGLPSHVEQNRDYWLDTVGYYCPWSSYVKEAL